MATATRTRHRWHAPEKGSGPAFALSLLAHAVLFIAIAFAVRWKSEPVGTVSAELWSLPPPAAVQQPAPPPPPPRPVKIEPPPPPEPEPPRKADIVEKKAPPKVEPKKEAPPKKEELKKVDPPKKIDPPKKDEAKIAAVKEAAQAAAERKAAAEAQEAQLKRLLAQAGPSANTAGAAGGGQSDAYSAQIRGCIRPHIIFNVPDAIRPQQYVARFEVMLLPTGEQTGAPRLLKSSGLSAYDQAVERAIRRCDPFPPPKEGTMPRSVTLSFDPVETR